MAWPFRKLSSSDGDVGHACAEPVSSLEMLASTSDRTALRPHIKLTCFSLPVRLSIIQAVRLSFFLSFSNNSSSVDP